MVNHVTVTMSSWHAFYLYANIGLIMHAEIYYRLYSHYDIDLMCYRPDVFQIQT